MTSSRQIWARRLALVALIAFGQASWTAAHAQGAAGQTPAAARPATGALSGVSKLNHIRFASEYAGRSRTGGIAEAVADFGAAPSCGLIVLPRGVVEVSETINLQSREGCIFMGHGNGQANASSSTSLHWVGPPNGTVLKVYGGRWGNYRDFTIDGNNTAGIGLDYTASNHGTGPAQENSFDRVSVINVRGTPGYAIHVGSSTADQISESTFTHFTLMNCATGIYQEGGQTVNLSYGPGVIGSYTRFGIYLESGALRTDTVDFQPNNAGTTDVYVGPKANLVTFINNYHEDTSGPDQKAYYFPGPGRSFASSLIGTYILWTNHGGTLLRYEQEGPVLLMGNQWFSNGRPEEAGSIEFAGKGGSPNSVSMYGNAIYGHKLSVSGNSAVIQDGQPLTGNAAGLLLNKASLNVTGNRFAFNGYTMVSNGAQLLWQDGSGHTFLGVGLGGPDRTDSGFSTTFVRSGNTAAGKISASNGFLRLAAGDAINFRMAPEQGADLNGLSTNAANQVVVGGAPGASVAQIRIGSLPFARLGVPENGQQVYCSNCDTPSAPGGTCTSQSDRRGAMAFRVRGTWQCY